LPAHGGARRLRSILERPICIAQNNRAGLEEARLRFQAAVDADTTFAPAYAGLAATYSALGLVFYGEPPGETRPKVIAVARKALELDPELAEARVFACKRAEKDCTGGSGGRIQASY